MAAIRSGMSPGLALDSDCGTSRGARGECGKKRRHSKADRGKRGTKCKRVEKGADARPKTGEPDAVARTPPSQVGAVGNAPPGETGASGSTQTPPPGQRQVQARGQRPWSSRPAWMSLSAVGDGRSDTIGGLTVR